MPPPDVSPEQKQTMEKLTKLQGAEFDRAYVKDMVEDHVKDVAAFEAVSKNATTITITNLTSIRMTTAGISPPSKS